MFRAKPECKGLPLVVCLCRLSARHALRLRLMTGVWVKVGIGYVLGFYSSDERGASRLERAARLH